MTKYVYLFQEGNANMRELLGGKGANLAEMANLGLPVPNGFTITTEACTQYYEDGKEISKEIETQILEALKKLEDLQGKKFGDNSDPLLVSVRSGARASMPGMMDTILNLGLNDESVKGFAVHSNNSRFAYDSYRRFIQMYADVVKGVPKSQFEEILDNIKKIVFNGIEKYNINLREYNYVLDRLYERSKWILDEEGKRIDEIGAIWYQPKNQEEYLTILKNSSLFSCVSIRNGELGVRNFRFSSVCCAFFRFRV